MDALIQAVERGATLGASYPDFVLCGRDYQTALLPHLVSPVKFNEVCMLNLLILVYFVMIKVVIVIASFCQEVVVARIFLPRIREFGPLETSSLFRR